MLCGWQTIRTRFIWKPDLCSFGTKHVWVLGRNNQAVSVWLVSCQRSYRNNMGEAHIHHAYSENKSCSSNEQGMLTWKRGSETISNNLFYFVDVWITLSPGERSKETGNQSLSTFIISLCHQAIAYIVYYCS